MGLMIYPMIFAGVPVQDSFIKDKTRQMPED